MYDIGDFHEIVDILAPQSTFDADYNEERISYVQEARVYASFSFDMGRDEEVDTDQITAHQRAKLVIRYLPGLSHKHRVVRCQDMSDWDIDRIQDDGRRRFQKIILKRAI